MIATLDSEGRKERSNVLLFRSSSHALPFAGAQFNVVIATFQLLQTNDPGVLSVLREAARVLLPRGKFVASNWEGPAQRAVAGPSQALRNLVCDAGFERLRDDGRLMSSAGIVQCLHARLPRHK